MFWWIKSMVYIRAHSLFCTFYWFWQMYIKKHPPLWFTQNSVTALKVPLCPTYFSLSLLTPGNPWSFYYFHGFAFSRKSCSRNHIYYRIPTFQIFFFHWGTCIYIYFRSFCGLIARSFSSLNNIPLCRSKSLSIHSPAEGHHGHLQVLAVMKKCDANIHVQVLV